MRKEIKKTDILKRPEYPGGQKAMKAFNRDNLQYPPKALEQKTEGVVHIRYAIDHKGQVVDVQVIRHLGHGCDEEAVRLVRLLRFNVGRTRGVRVLFHKTIQIHFRLPPARDIAPQATMQVSYTLTPAKPKPSVPKDTRSVIIFTLPEE